MVELTTRKKAIIIGVPVAAGVAVGLWWFLTRTKKVTVSGTPKDWTLCVTNGTITVKVSGGMFGKPQANVTGKIYNYIGGGQAGDPLDFGTDANGSWSGSFCWYATAATTPPTTDTYITWLVKAVLSSGEIGTWSGRLLIPAGQVTPCSCPGQ